MAFVIRRSAAWYGISAIVLVGSAFRRAARLTEGAMQSEIETRADIAANRFAEV
jgi:hypothetical protein